MTLKPQAVRSVMTYPEFFILLIDVIRDGKVGLS